MHYDSVLRESIQRFVLVINMELLLRLTGMRFPRTQIKESTHRPSKFDRCQDVKEGTPLVYSNPNMDLGNLTWKDSDSSTTLKVKIEMIMFP